MRSSLFTKNNRARTGMEAGFTQTLGVPEASLVSGFTMLIAIVTTSILLLVSFVVINVALKQLVLTYSGQESQYSFYNGDSGLECAMFWDLKNGATSAFDTGTAGSVTCNGQTVTTGSQSVPTVPAQQSRIGGGGVGAPTSIFSITYPHGCAIVRVTKNPDGTTFIESRGYNTCSTSDRRFERGISITY
jgi:hypothetical protein